MMKPQEAMTTPGITNISLEQLLNGNPVPTFVLNAEHVVTHWNRGCEQVMGMPAARMIGTRNQWQAFYAEPRPVMADIIIDHANPEQIERFYPGKYRPSKSIPGAYEAEDYFPNFPGGGRWLYFTAAPLIDPEGNVAGAIETLQDITERKLADLQLQALNNSLEQRIAERTAELENANLELRHTIARMEQMQAELLRSQEAALCASQAKSDFLATMSHEIRTPMNGIIGMTELALDTPLTDEQREYLNIVKSSADGLISIINDILDFSKIEAGKLTVESISFNLHGLVSSILKPLAVRADEKEVELICDIPEQVPAQVIGDPGRIRQILINLLGNALKFTEKGEIELKLSLAASTPVPLILFAVRDSGIGIPPEKQRLIFEAFSQADTSTTRHYGGTGLGLTISSRLSSLMGGRIWVESDGHSGSTFFLEIPLPVAREHPPARFDARNIVGKRALIIDDNAINRRIFREMLGRWGVLVEEDISALAMLKNLELRQSQGFDFFIVDYHMPGMDGFALIETLQEKHAFPDTKLLMLSSAAMAGHGNRCRELGIAAYLTKPVDRQELYAALNKIMAPATPEANTTPPELVTRHSIHEENASLSVLVAEDNEVNQKLIRTLLEQHGHRVTLAANGEEAVTAYRNSRFDIVLMDLQMPVLGGIEAARQIRAHEAGTPGGQRTPIHALTAAVLPDVREECLRTGIDGYLTKPINKTELYRTLSGIKAPPGPPGPCDTLPLAHDYRSGLEQCDREILEIIGEPFLFSQEQEMGKLQQACAHGDIPTVERLAHTYKGLATQFNAKPLAALFQETERLARTGQLDHTLIDNCLNELATFNAILAEFLAG